jgi:DNA mismatch endonuclease (patch repair protein)
MEVIKQEPRMSDNMSVAQRSWTMSRIRSKDTRPEKMVRSFLHSRGFRFRLHKRSLPGAPDIVLPRFHTVIFVHGCFWHAHRSCRYATSPRSNRRYWRRKLDGNVDRHQRNVSALKAAGWRVITIWECQIKRSPQAVRQRLIRVLPKRSANRSG